METVLFLHNFAKDDTLVGKHLLIANLTYLQALDQKKQGLHTDYVYIKTRPHQHVVDIIKRFNFNIIGDEVFERTFDEYVFAGTGVARVIMPKGVHRPFDSLKNINKKLNSVVKKTGTDFNRSSALWYLKVFDYLKDKTNVINTVIDPVFDMTVKEFEHVYFCDYYKGCGVEIKSPAVSDYGSNARNFRWRYMDNIGKEYLKRNLKNLQYLDDRKSDIFANFNNISRFNLVRRHGIAMANYKGLINIGTTKYDLIYSINDYMDKLQEYRFTLVTYSYDPQTISLLRAMDALAVGVLPLFAVDHKDIKKSCGEKFANYVKESGLNVMEKSFNFETVKNFTPKEHYTHRDRLIEILSEYE